MSDLLRRLCEPFEARFISWKPGSATKDGNKCMAMAYADLRAYQERLDEVCGLDWSCRYVPWGDGRIICELTIGGVTRSSTGEMDAQDEKNGMGGTVAEAQAMKRAAAQFGLGRYLYDLPNVWVEFDPSRKRITEAGQKQLEDRYATWYAKKKASVVVVAPVATTTNGAGYQDDELWEPRETVKAADVLSKAQLSRIKELGVSVFGATAFLATEAKTLAEKVSDNKIALVGKLNSQQAQAVITELEKLVKEKVTA